MSKANRHVGSSLDDFLREEGLLEEARAIAIKEAVAFQVQKAMETEQHQQSGDGAPHEDQPRGFGSFLAPEMPRSLFRR